MELLTAYLPIILLVCQVIGGLTLAATILVRIPLFKPATNIVVDVDNYWLKVVSWLPTIGIDPHTQNLIAALQAEMPTAAPLPPPVTPPKV
jgi:hypothetical protein